MTVRLGTLKALAMLLPAGVLGISSTLSAASTKPSPTETKTDDHVIGVADRLGEIRAAVSRIDFENAKIDVHPDAVALTADWPNFHFGWGNGGWRNGGWGNGGWRNGGWGNGGWHNGGWGNGGGGPWHNWHNFWHNW
jgi:rSAM-associated Gly-rich repeat protein